METLTNVPVSKEITVSFSKTVVTEQTELQTDETDDYIIPEAWWEDVRYAEEFSKVYDTTVTHWMPLPEPPKEVSKE